MADNNIVPAYQTMQQYAQASAADQPFTQASTYLSSLTKTITDDIKNHTTWIIVGIAGAGLLGYWGYRYAKKRKARHGR